MTGGSSWDSYYKTFTNIIITFGSVIDELDAVAAYGNGSFERLLRKVL